MVERPVTACVLIIGNEILSGRTQDSNLQHIAERLNAHGVRVSEARVIPDLEAAIIAAVNEARARFDYVFTTGGIGPTHDDITAESIAKAFGQRLIEHPDIAARIRSRPAPPDVMASRLRMARVPADAQLIENPTGGPEGFRIENVYVMAGIPRVMQAMLSTVLDRLQGGAPLQSRSLTVYTGESRIAGLLGALQARHPEVDLGSYPFMQEGRFGTTLVLRASERAALEQMYHALRSALEASGEQVWESETQTGQMGSPQR